MALEDRIRLFVSQQPTTLIAALALAGVLCFVAAGYIYVTPTVTTVTEETNVQTVETTVTTSAVVTGNTTLYEPQAELQNRSVYFVSATPQLTLTVRSSVPADQSVAVTHELRMETVGLREGRPFYRNERTLVDEQTVVSDGTARSETTMNVSALRQALQNKQAEVGSVGRFRIRLLLNTTYETDAYDGTISTDAPFVLSGRAYYLDGELAVEQTHSTPVTEQIVQQPTVFEYGSVGVLGLILFGLCWVVIRISRQADPELLRVNIVHDRHQEWISRGEFPTDSNKEYISILALEDLVDVAIDSDRRVLFDPELDAYAVIDGDEIYYYARNEEDTDVWFDF